MQVPVLALADRAVPAIATGHAIGRIGCLLGGCCFGKPAHGLLAIHYTDPLAPAAVVAGLGRQPVPLYEAAALLGLALGCALRPLHDPGSGRRLRCYALAYAGLRLGLESLRGDDVRGVFFGGAVSVAQLIAFTWIVGSLGVRWRAALALACRRVLRRAWPVTLALLPFAVSHRAAADRFERLPMAAADTVWIRPGWFEMGSDAGDVAFAVASCRQQTGPTPDCEPRRFSDEQPRHRVFVSGFRIDRYELSLGAYQRCVQHGQCPPPRAGIRDAGARLAFPLTLVTQTEATRYCAWLGGRLPREAEWERAARGSSARRFPWGAGWNANAANFARTTVAPALVPVAAFQDGASFYGLLQMAGNVWELTADRYDPSYYARSPSVDPEGGQGDQITIRGGSWRSPGYNLRAAQRAGIKPEESRDDVGFRCAYDLP
jgi:formylglycine-generating enzyme required for sulfatase activity